MPIQITTATPHQPTLFARHLAEGRVRVRTLGDVLSGFRLRPEHKSLAPDGNPTTRRTKGQLRRRPIESAPVLTDLIGKEGNNLEERTLGIGDDPSAHRNEFGTRGDRFNQLVVPVLRELGPAEVMRRTGRQKSAVYEVLAGKAGKYEGAMAAYLALALEEAKAALSRAGVSIPRHIYGILYSWRLTRPNSGEDWR